VLSCNAQDILALGFQEFVDSHRLNSWLSLPMGTALGSSGPHLATLSCGAFLTVLGLHVGAQDGIDLGLVTAALGFEPS
jgi:hypothetical protein